MDETWAIIYPEAKYLTSCESVKPNKLYASKYNGRTGLRYLRLFSNGELEKKEGEGPKQVQNIVRKIPEDLKIWDYSSLVLCSAFWTH